jgi:hypothetical protein
VAARGERRDLGLQFDHYTVTLLILRSDAPPLDEAALDVLQVLHKPEGSQRTG